jgi:beta-fructofuranosidase
MKKSPLGTDRRQFLSYGVALIASSSPLVSLADAGITPMDQAKPATPALASDPMRPQFHLLPAKNWMNDPNGPIFFNGNYHMFFQYNPLAATWGDMSWNHAISPDMVHWRHLPVAMTPTPDSPDSFGVFSGSAIAVGRRVYAVYTGTRKSDDAHATIRDGANDIQESQCLAWSDDPQLVHWTKEPEPVIPAPPPGMRITGFRDPSAWKQGDSYYMTVGAGEAKVGGCVLLYTSKDLRQWQYLHKLTGGEWNGKPTPNPCDDGEMWECPELFPLGDAHVLIYSTLGKVYWQSGTLDPVTMKFAANKTGLLDFDAFYAPKTQLDAQGRRIIWGWIPERRSEDAMRAAGWSGMMSLPRLLTLDQDGTLRISTPQQVNTLRVGELSREPSTTGILKTLHRASGEALCTGSRGHDFDLSFRDGETVLAQITYSADDHSLTADGHTVALQPQDDPQIHAYVDGSVIELVLGERVGYTKRFYYAAPTAPDIAVVATGRQPLTLHAWKLAPISNNRLTTPA